MYPIVENIGCAIVGSMNTAFDVLVIGLGCLLAIYLIISIVIVILIMKLIKSLREVIAKGEHFIDSAGAIGDVLRQNAGAVGVVRVLMHFMNNMSGGKHGRKG